MLLRYTKHSDKLNKINELSFTLDLLQSYIPKVEQKKHVGNLAEINDIVRVFIMQGGYRSVTRMPRL